MKVAALVRSNPPAFVAVCLAGTWACAALLVPWMPLPDPAATDLSLRLASPGFAGHPLGTDLLGRDMLARLLWGTRLSLGVAAAATLVAAFAGSLLGLVAGTLRGWVDGLLMRLTDVVMAFPYLLLALGIIAVLGPGLANALLAMAIVNLPFFARAVRGAALPVAGSDCIAAARMAGRGSLGILIREVLPNVLPVIVVTSTTTLGWMVLETAGLSFLGLGAQPPAADLGSMLAESRKVMLVQPWLAALPGLAVFVLVLGANLGGDMLRDALDPRSGTAASAPGRATAVLERLAPRDGDSAPLVLRDLRVDVVARGGGSLAVVDTVSLRVGPGGSLGLVGESGSGKSATALAAMRLLPTPPLVIARGSISVSGGDVLAASSPELRAWRGTRAGFIFQNPLSALDPMMRIVDQVAEVLLVHGGRHRVWERATDLLAGLGLPRNRVSAYPHEFSGGMRQRVAIAMALANQPGLLVADEPTTALDPATQGTVLATLSRAVSRRGAALLLISHDLGAVAKTCNRIAVLYAGEIVEEGPAARVLASPLHPYTRALLACRPGTGSMRAIAGQPPQPGEFDGGCRFAPRCPLAMPACREAPVPLEHAKDHAVRCIVASRDRAV
jgi:peptide/nickel transport system permease protein